MSFLKWIRVPHGQRVVVYRDGCPVELLRPGRHLRMALGGGLGIERFSTREPWVESIFLEEIARSGVLAGDAVVLDLAAGERAIVRIDGRYAGVRGEGVWAVWTAGREVEVERFAIGFGRPGAGPERNPLRLEHPAPAAIVQLPGAKEQLEAAAVPALATRREETAAIRMQANTARIFESNPTPLRLREPGVLEGGADEANLTVVLGEGGLAERVVEKL